MKHIAYITTEYPHKSTAAAGGIGSFVKTMATFLLKKGYKVTVFLCLSNKEIIWFDGDIRIIEIKALKPSKLSVFKDRLHLARIIKKHIKKERIDLIEASDWEGLHAFSRFKIPLITRVHGSVTYFNHLQNIPKPKLLYFLEKKALKKSNKIIAVSKFSGNLTKEIFKLPNLNFEVIYNGINTNIFKNINVENEKSNSILYFGTLARKKGSIALAHIFNKLHESNKNIILTLIGKDSIDFLEKKSTWAIIQSILTTSALKQVKYKGIVPYKEMNLEITKASVCVFPSFAEAFPISWLEAMAMEKPIVASSIGWAKESIIDNTSGLLESPENYNLFAEKINRIVNDVSFGVKLGKKARKRVLEFFDQNSLISQNIDLYKSILNDE